MTDNEDPAYYGPLVILGALALVLVVLIILGFILG
jgi:hypothetical protein